MENLIVSLSLPKTGTTYLGSLLSQLDGFELPVIKEPNFFFETGGTNCHLMSDILSPGNFYRGFDWYNNLFPKRNTVRGLDMSTQYWLHCEEVLNNAASAPITYLSIKRDPTDQLISYVSHLRRGHVDENSLQALIEKNPSFGEYLHEMQQWNDRFKQLQVRCPGLNLVEIDFQDLTDAPEKVVASLSGIAESRVRINVKGERNKKSYPRFPFFNRFLFSRAVRKMGRRLPGKIYSKAVALRKEMVKKNLIVGQGPFHESDRRYIREHFSGE